MIQYSDLASYELVDFDGLNASVRFFGPNDEFLLELNARSQEAQMIVSMIDDWATQVWRAV